MIRPKFMNNIHDLKKDDLIYFADKRDEENFIAHVGCIDNDKIFLECAIRGKSIRFDEWNITTLVRDYTFYKIGPTIV